MARIYYVESDSLMEIGPAGLLGQFRNITAVVEASDYAALAEWTSHAIYCEKSLTKGNVCSCGLDEAMRDKTGGQREIIRQQALVLDGIGPLMDSWDHLPNDVKDDLREESPGLCAELERIAQIYGGNCDKYLE